MKKPIKPNAPKKPKKPEQVQIVSEERNLWCYSLQSLLDDLRNDEKVVRDYATVERQNPLDYSKIFFVTDSENEMRASWRCEYKYTFTDKHFQKELMKYGKALVAYQAKYASYEEKMKKYEEALAVYKEAMAKERQKAELAEFERLKKLYAKQLRNALENSTSSST